MKVYAVIRGHDYEGYSEPNGIFSTLELAREAVEKLEMGNDEFGWDDIDIYEYDLDRFEDDWKDHLERVRREKITP